MRPSSARFKTLTHAQKKASEPPRPARFLVASLGHPEPHHSSRQSAGHHLLQALARKYSFPAMISTPQGLTSSGRSIGLPEYTLWQSGYVMERSGRALLPAWNAFQDEHHRTSWTALVILHDEIHLEPGTIKLQRGILKGMNPHIGVTSIRNVFKQAGRLQQLGQRRLIRIGIGIGRPESDGQADLDAYLLEPLTEDEKADIAAKATQLGEWLDEEMDSLPASKGESRKLWRNDRTAEAIKVQNEAGNDSTRETRPVLE